MHVLVDGRPIRLPSLHANLFSLVPVADEDIERIELLMGPGSAPHGANATGGALHLTTRSSLEGPVTRMSVLGGERGLRSGSISLSRRLAEDVGLRVSATYLQGDEWEYADSVELSEARRFEARRALWRDESVRIFGVSAEEADRRLDRVGQRDFSIDRWSASARLDWDRSPESLLTFGTGAAAIGSEIRLTGLGAVQLHDWRHLFAQGRMEWNGTSGQVHVNRSDSGDSYFLRSGSPFLIRSTTLGGLLRRTLDTGPRHRLTYGFDVEHSRPDTEGVLHGAWERDDATTGLGAFVQGEADPREWLQVVGSGRLDRRSELAQAAFSSRAALVVTPSDSRTLRIAHDRSFLSPSSLEHFVDFGSPFPGLATDGFGPSRNPATIGHSVRFQGPGTSGFRFGQGEGAPLLMRSPFPGPGGGTEPGALVPAILAPEFWEHAVATVEQWFSLPGSLVEFLFDHAPTSGEVSAGYRDHRTGATGPLSDLVLEDVAPLRHTTQTTLEIGYAGSHRNGRLSLVADLWRTERRDPIVPLTHYTPFVTLLREDVAAFLLPHLLAEGFSEAAAEMWAHEFGVMLAEVPVGVISAPEMGASTDAAVLSTWTNVRERFAFWGADLSGHLSLTERVGVGAGVSLASRDSFTTEAGHRIALNAPSRRARAEVAFHDPGHRYGLGLEARFVGRFPVVSGVYQGIGCLEDAPEDADPCVDSHTVLDLSAHVPLPFDGASAQLRVRNLLDDEYRDFVGVPRTGRMGMIRVRYHF